MVFQEHLSQASNQILPLPSQISLTGLSLEPQIITRLRKSQAHRQWTCHSTIDLQAPSSQKG